ncbi:hypothetical protein [Rhodococcus rhodnii]|uniref:Uncharacterized protein n=1 Tax=Rhodococcus rhodnii LMG 5362 TaxID=1273125 RepID=R7WS82_9NOCA|nr:hypothetical protein [Rhodococcus rhodnii]EOM76794.1 hypothetical protein Rrhod_1914 [Rhodococcus rhodnii LMG 5362]
MFHAQKLIAETHVASRRLKDWIPEERSGADTVTGPLNDSRLLARTKIVETVPCRRENDALDRGET